ncbi:polysaccharide biosynthesis/export family protein [Pedobacter sp. SYP-B3415]|uniref:polysaccharide biosynthesis/export family protein n=1 Tax=Pedobacter sp. SYP-B3415 TaxID=2496641 RepID=UPI001F10A05A|nr:polysaccharide biosynthesis/export family protein [Pedobacter sp. SYP-B3415]
MKNDLLAVIITTSSNESNMLFAANAATLSPNGMYEREGFRVDKNGNIKLPVVGNIRLEGLSTSEAQKTLEKAIDRFVKNPIVTVKYMNFRVTVIGEVAHPATFTVSNDKISVLEALGMAGDMTPYGKRENVLIIRENDGQRTTTRINLNHKDVLNSPYFYLQQNDVVYVEPDKAKAIEYSRSTRSLPVVVAVISGIAVLATALLNRL